VKDPFRLDDEVALITGGGTGLGLGIARCFVRAGARIVIVGRREAELQKASAELGSKCSYISHDVLHFDRAPELVKRAEELANAPISVLVNNAGIHLKKQAVLTTPAEFNAVLQTHVVAAHALVTAAVPGMMERKHGSVLFTASMAALFGIPLVVAYSAAKTAYLGMVRSLATEVAGHGVRVNAIAPGWIESPMLRGALAGDPGREQKILSRTPMNRFGDAEDIGCAAVYLSSPAASFITGITLPVDGGAYIGF
jgi:NAD(P)-dependent dehydrogenase (short-subunit alcohol dehydrogenase family)